MISITVSILSPWDGSIVLVAACCTHAVIRMEFVVGDEIRECGNQ